MSLLLAWREVIKYHLNDEFVSSSLCNFVASCPTWTNVLIWTYYYSEPNTQLFWYNLDMNIYYYYTQPKNTHDSWLQLTQKRLSSISKSKGSGVLMYSIISEKEKREKSQFLKVEKCTMTLWRVAKVFWKWEGESWAHKTLGKEEETVAVEFRCDTKFRSVRTLEKEKDREGIYLSSCCCVLLYHHKSLFHYQKRLQKNSKLVSECHDTSHYGLLVRDKSCLFCYCNVKIE